jgi:hypothetical protein
MKTITTIIATLIIFSIIKPWLIRLFNKAIERLQQ